MGGGLPDVATNGSTIDAQRAVARSINGDLDGLIGRRNMFGSVITGF